MLSLLEAAQKIGKSKSTLRRAVKDGKLTASRNTDGEYQIDPSELFRVYSSAQEREQQPTVNPTGDVVSTLVNQLVDMRAELAAKDQKNGSLAEELADTEQRLAEQREASRALMSPEDFDAKVTALTKELQQQHEARLAEQQKQHEIKNRKWQESLAERQSEITAARNEANELRQKATEDIAMVERRAAAERAAREALLNRGLIARLLNRKPAIVE